MKRFLTFIAPAAIVFLSVLSCRDWRYSPNGCCRHLPSPGFFPSITSYSDNYSNHRFTKTGLSGAERDESYWNPLILNELISSGLVILFSIMYLVMAPRQVLAHTAGVVSLSPLATWKTGSITLMLESTRFQSKSARYSSVSR